MAYTDGFIVPVPKKKLPAYRRMAQKAGKIWKEHGALAFRECVADDVKVDKRTSFPRSVSSGAARRSSSLISCSSPGQTATASTPR